jgi:nicotinamide riboside transporter PnuC
VDTLIWSWVLAIVGIFGIFLVGQKTIWGWPLLLINECLWIVYAIQTEQYGFIFAAIVYGLVYIKSYLFWKKDNLQIV